MADEVAILGVGMHPWGKWGRKFVEYGVKACRDALEDAGVEWKEIQFVSGADTMRCGYPGYVAGATFAQARGHKYSVKIAAQIGKGNLPTNGCVQVQLNAQVENILNLLVQHLPVLSGGTSADLEIASMFLQFPYHRGHLDRLWTGTEDT